MEHMDQIAVVRMPDARTVRQEAAEKPQAQTCFMMAGEYETVPRPPHPPMIWE